jgi:hypothetical protein
MLIWYANIPEEVTYFMTRIEDFNLPFFGITGNLVSLQAHGSLN